MGASRWNVYEFNVLDNIVVFVNQVRRCLFLRAFYPVHTSVHQGTTESIRNGDFRLSSFILAAMELLIFFI